MIKDFVKRTLNNGLVVYFYKDKNLKRTIVSYNVKYGSNGYFDDFYLRNKLYHVEPGMAHFLEHTLIETCKYGNMIHRFLDKNYSFNGLTYGNLTSFYFVGIKGIKTSLKELIEMVDDPVFTKETIEGVKPAIIDEVRKNDDEKYAPCYNINKRNLYREYESCPENGNQLGSKETTKKITYQDALACYEAYYNIENKFLVIGGPIDIDEYVDYLNSIFLNLKPHPNEYRPVIYENRGIRKVYDEVTKNVDEEHLIVSYRIKNDLKDDLSLIDLALYFLLRTKFSEDTDFVNSLIKEKIIVGGMGWNTSYFNGDIILTFGVAILNKDEFIKRLDLELKNTKLVRRKFELLKRSLIANELSKFDYIYRAIKKFPVDIDYSEKLFLLDILEKCSFDKVEEILRALDYGVKSILHIKKVN